MGLVMTSLIAGAIASFMISVARCWNASEELQTATIRASQFTERLASKLRGAKLIGYWNDGSIGSACLIYWRDANNDGVMVLSELGAIAYNPASHTINFHAQTVAVGDPDPVCTTLDFTTGVVATTLISTGRAKPMIRDVSSAQLSVSNASSLTVAPTVAWVVDFQESDSSVVTRVCTASLRAPATP